MTSYNQNEEQFCVQNNNTNILGEPRKDKSYLSYESINQNSNIFINMEKSYNSLPIFDWEEEKERSNNSIDEDNLYFLPKKSSIRFESKKLLKRGKKRKQQEINESESKGYIKIHDKYTIDNILIKIQVHYITFIVSFINEILENLGFKQRFLHLDYSIKKNVKIEYINYLKNEDIGKILCNKISNKYKKEKNINFEIYNELKEDKILKNFFSKKYSLLFKSIYYNSNKIIDLKEYGKDQTISLSDKVKMFQDLLKDIEKKDINGKYRQNIDVYARKYFFPSKFKTKDYARKHSKLKFKI